MLTPDPVHRVQPSLSAEWKFVQVIIARAEASHTKAEVLT